MTLSLNCQTILWPIQHSAHPVRWPLGIGGAEFHYYPVTGIREQIRRLLTDGPGADGREGSKTVIR